MADIDTSFIDNPEKSIPITEVSIDTSKDEQEDPNTDTDGLGVLFYKRVQTRNVLKANYKLALAIDPSQNGSGFSIYDNRQGQESLKLVSSTLSPLTDPKKDSLCYFKMQNEFANDLVELINTYVDGGTKAHFDMVIIEDTVMNHSPLIFKKLVLINHVIDALIARGTIDTDAFIRVNNVTWKSFLYTYKVGKRYKKTKKEIEDILYFLEEPFVLENINQTQKWKKATQYQDKLDSLGMMLVGRDVQKHFAETKVSKRKIKYKYHLISQLTDDIRDSHLPITLMENGEVALRDAIEYLRKERVKKKYYIEVSQSQLGSFGIKNDLYVQQGKETAYLILD